jgi:hypothetical protein
MVFNSKNEINEDPFSRHFGGQEQRMRSCRSKLHVSKNHKMMMGKKDHKHEKPVDNGHPLDS